MSAHQTGLLEHLLPKLTLALEQGRDPRRYFSSPSPGGRGPGGGISEVWLEIGFGGGEHLFWQAEANPDIGIIGAEPYVAGMAKLLTKLSSLSHPAGEGRGEEESKDQPPPPHPSPLPQKGRGENIRLYQEDAHDILGALPDACLSRVFILFPDPWPKKRHHKRRFIQMESLGEFARVMKPGAELRFATDDPGYLVWALERLTAHPAFEWLAECASDWRARPSDWPQTRYEAKAIRQGRACTYLRFVRRA